MLTHTRTIIFRSLAIACFTPFLITAQPGRPALRPELLRVDAHRNLHQPAAMETLEEHSPHMQTSEVAGPVVSKKVGELIEPSLRPGTNAAADNGLGFQGTSNWTGENGLFTIQVPRVVNNGRGTTGSLRLRLWASQSGFANGSISGYVLVTWSYPSTLRPGESYPATTLRLQVTPAPEGTYRTTLTLEQYNGSGWPVADYINYGGSATFGPARASGSAPKLEGYRGWFFSGDVLNIRADRVINNGQSTSGSLRLEVWATERPYAGGTISGFVLGAYGFPNPLPPGAYYADVSREVTFHRPADGTYHSTITLEEYTADGWVIRDYYTLDSTTTFGEPKSDPCTFKEINTLGDAVSGTLSSNSCLNAGFYMDGYQFFAVAGYQVKIVMRSPDFYTFQTLLGPNLDILAAATENFGDQQTEVTLTIPTTGTYVLTASSVDPVSFRPGDLGRYAVSVRVY